MPYFSYNDALAAVTTNDAMGALDSGNGSDSVGSLSSVYGMLSDTPAGALSSVYGFSDTPPATVTRDAEGFPSFAGSGNAQKSWALARAGMRAGTINPAAHGSNKALTGKYMLEALDPRHRVADMLVVMLKIFVQKADVQTAARLSLFFDWLDMLSQEAPEVIYSTFKNNNIASVSQFIQAGVSYLSAAQRGDYRIHIKDGLLYQGNKLFDSRDHSTVFSGKGWAIFVTSPSGQLYAGSHKAGQFHHSSFLAGRQIMAAGELRVERGVLQVITGKSGHYKPTIEQLIAGVRELQKRGARMDAARIKLFNGSEEQLVPVNFYLASPGAFRRLNAWGS
jgi:hypothetical protein